MQLKGWQKIVLAAGLVAVPILSCGQRSLVLMEVTVSGNTTFSNATLAITANDDVKTDFPDVTLDQTPYKAGVYLPSDMTGMVTFKAEVDQSGCIVGTGTATADVSSGGTTGPVQVTITPMVPCTPITDGGSSGSAGTGGAAGTGGTGGLTGAAGSGGKSGAAGSGGTSGTSGAAGLDGRRRDRLDGHRWPGWPRRGRGWHDRRRRHGQRQGRLGGHGRDDGRGWLVERRHDRRRRYRQGRHDRRGRHQRQGRHRRLDRRQRRNGRLHVYRQRDLQLVRDLRLHPDPGRSLRGQRRRMRHDHEQLRQDGHLHLPGELRLRRLHGDLHVDRLPDGGRRIDHHARARTDRLSAMTAPSDG